MQDVTNPVSLPTFYCMQDIPYAPLTPGIKFRVP